MVNTTKQTAGSVDERLLKASSGEALAAVTSAGDKATSLVDAWVRAGNIEAVSAVAEHGSGPARKSARRGIQVLGSRGIKLAAAPRVVSVSGAPAEVVTEAWLVPPDSHGSVLIVIASRSATSRVHAGFFYLRSGFGLDDATVGEVSFGKLKDSLRRASASGLEPVQISPAYARQRVDIERKRHAELKLPEPLGMLGAGPLLEPVPEALEPHPLDAEGLELSDEDVSELAEKSAMLHQLPEFRSWLPDRKVVDELLASVGKKLGPDEAGNAERVQAVVKEEVDATTDRYFTPERRESLASLMKDSALSVLASHGEVRALEVVAAIKSIQNAGLITNPPHAVPFLRAFFEKAVLALAMRNGGRLSVPLPADAAAGGSTAAEPG